MRKFKRYRQAREYFQGTIGKLRVSELREFLESVEEIRDSYDFLSEKCMVVNLIIDIEHQIDLLEDPELLKHLQKKLYQPHVPIPAPVEPDQPPMDMSKSLDIQIRNIHNHTNLWRDLERLMYERVLFLCAGNKTKAAEAIGTTQKTVYNKMAKYRLGEYAI